MNIGIYSRIIKKNDIVFVKQMMQLLHQNDIGVLVHSNFLEQLNVHQIPVSDSVKVFNEQDNLKQHINCLLSVGGDGTMLNTLTMIKDTGIPVLGINSGRLGLLTAANKEGFTQNLLNDLKTGNYNVDQRTVLQFNSSYPNLFSQLPFALNEFTIHKLDASAMITIHTYVDGVFLNSYWADGVIVATPTGSTAYSLSCGGPIMQPSAQAFIITPVAPHNLNVRPMVIPDTSTISFEVEGRSEEFLCTLDSRIKRIGKDCQLSVKKANFVFNLIRLQGNDFYATIRHKLMWGMDSRN